LGLFAEFFLILIDSNEGFSTASFSAGSAGCASKYDCAVSSFETYSKVELKSGFSSLGSSHVYFSSFGVFVITLPPIIRASSSGTGVYGNPSLVIILLLY
jgi:hypothetical protein